MIILSIMEIGSKVNKIYMNEKNVIDVQDEDVYVEGWLIVHEFRKCIYWSFTWMKIISR